jgi:Fe-S cluster assembly protein SufD
MMDAMLSYFPVRVDGGFKEAEWRPLHSGLRPSIEANGRIIFTLEAESVCTIIDHIEVSCQKSINLNFHLCKGSSFTYIPIIMGGTNVTLNITVHLADDAHAQIKGAYVLKNTQQYTITTRQHHTGKRATSSVTLNGIACEQSLITYTGTIVVDANATQTQASQENKTILWDVGARAISIPALEVQTNDVQCAHGSAMGPLNKDHILYAQSRGISLADAQRLLVRSFLVQTLGDAQEDSIERLLSAVMEP